MIDWSPFPNEAYHQLRASLVYQGRALPLISLLVTKQQQHDETISRQLLSYLKCNIDKTKQVTIITDAGFHAWWFKAIEDLGWYYVGRIKNQLCFSFEDMPKNWLKPRDYPLPKKNKPIYLGKGLLSKVHQLKTQFYLYHSSSKGRNGEPCRIRGKRKDYSKSNKEPWMLVSNLPDTEALTIVNIYKCRMQIEQNFRDEKNPQFGFGARMSKSKGVCRLANLCMLTILASVILWLHGFYLEYHNKHKDYQANTVKRRTLSYIQLPKNALLQCSTTAPPLKWLDKMLIIISSQYNQVVFKGSR